MLDALWESDDLDALGRALDVLRATFLGLENNDDDDDEDDDDVVERQQEPSTSRRDLDAQHVNGTSLSGVAFTAVGIVAAEEDNNRSSESAAAVPDPTEAFLAIQAAFLRVVVAAKDTDNTDDFATTTTTTTDHVHQQQQQQQQMERLQRIQWFGMRCLRVVEALARRVVGPAWRGQLRRQRRRAKRRRQRLRRRVPTQRGAEATTSTTPAPSHHRYQLSEITASLRGGTGSGMATTLDGSTDDKDDDFDFVGGVRGGNRRRTVSDGSEEWRRHQRGGQQHDANSNHEPSQSRGGDPHNDSGGIHEEEEEEEQLLERPTRYPPIPELLPAAMIRFAAYFSSSSLRLERGERGSSDGNGTPRNNDAVLVAQMEIVRALAIPTSRQSQQQQQQQQQHERSPSADSDDDDDATFSESGQIVGVLAEMRAMVRMWLARSRSRSSSGSVVAAEPDAGDRGRRRHEQDAPLLALETYRDLLVDGGWRPNPALREGQYENLEEHHYHHDPNAGWCHEAVMAVLASVAETRESASTGAIPETDDSSRKSDDSSRRGRRLREASIDCLRLMAEFGLVPAADVHRIATELLPLVPLHATESDGSFETLHWLLRHETTAVPAMDVILATLDVVGDGSSSSQQPMAQPAPIDASDIDDARRATTIAATALFGNSAGAAAIPILRVYFDTYLQTTFLCLSHCINEISAGSNGPDRAESVHGDHLEMFGRDLLAGLSRALLSQCQQPATTDPPLYLSVIEWERIITNAKSCITPWLSLSGVRSRQAATDLVRNMGSFLDYSTDHDPVPFVEFDLQQQLYLWLLQDSISTIGDEQTKTAVAVSTIRNWIKYGMFPFRLEDWSSTASSIIREAFRRSEPVDRATSPYIYDATVRLEAIRALTRESSNDSTGELDVHQSLLVFTQHMRELHLDLVRSSIIPCLKDVLFSARNDEAEDLPVIPTGPLDMVHDLEPKVVAESFEITVPISSRSKVARSELLRYCVQLAGRLYRSVSGDRGLRLLFVEMLQSVALDECTSTNPEKRSKLADVRIVAVLELSKCLEAAFVTLRHAHESVPNLVRSLCKVLDCVTHSRQTIIDDASTYIEMTVLGVAALDPLTRLRVAIDGKVAFRARQQRTSSTSDLLLPFFAEATVEYRSAVVETHGSPCVGIEGLICSSSSATRVSFEGIIDSVVAFLQTTADQRQVVHLRALSFADKCMRIHCFDVLRHQFLASTPVRLPCRVARAVFSTNSCHSEDPDVAVAKGLALIRCAENAVILVKCRRSNDTMIHKQDLDLLPEVLNLVLELMVSDISKLRVIARHGITAILPGLIDFDRTFNTDFGGQILSFVNASLIAATDAWNSSKPSASVALSILSLMHDVFGLQTDIDDGLLIRLIMFASTVSAGGSDLKGSYAVHLAAECVALSLDRLTVDGLNEAFKVLRSASLPNGAILERLCHQVHLQRIARLRKDQIPRIMTNVSDRDELERLSEESLNVESFPASKSGAWLLADQVLFTCRVGTPLSRYNGFLEVATRTLAGRSRSMLRIPGCASVYDPEFPSPLRCPWDNNASAVWPVKLRSGSIERSEQDPPLSSIVAAVTEKFNKIMAQDAGHLGLEEEDGEPDVVELPVDRNADTVCDDSPTFRNDLSFWLEEVLTVSSTDRSDLDSEILSFLCRATGSAETQWPEMRRLDLDANLERVIGVLDRTPSSSTYKVGFLYDQSARRTNAAPVDMETRLLMTRAGSPGYYHFAHRLGKVVPTKFLRYYSGGLDTSRHESDGLTALMWTDSDVAGSTVGSRFVVFHAVDMMPVSSKSTSVSRKRHIGNDYVLILFADRGSDAIVEFDLKGGELIGGAFGFVVIWVTVAQPGIFRINVRVRKQPMNDELNDVLSTFVSDNAVAEAEAPTFVRNIVMRADLACRAATGASDAQCNYMYRYHLLRDMARFVKPGITS
jgi:Rap/ran-GAP